MARLCLGDANQIRNHDPQHLFSLVHFLLTFESTHFGQKRQYIDRQARLYRGTQGLPRLGYHLEKIPPIFLLFKRQKGQLEAVMFGSHE
jgi:hypothetical protein